MKKQVRPPNELTSLIKWSNFYTEDMDRENHGYYDFLNIS